MTIMQETIIREAIKMYEDYRKEYERFGHSSSLYIDDIHQLELLDFDINLIDLIRDLIDRQLDRHEDPEKLIRRIDHVLNVIRSEDI